MEIRETDDWDSLRPQWDDLLARSSRATVFQSWDWVRNIWKHGIQRGESLLLTFHIEGQLVGIAPLVKLGGGTKVKRLLIAGGDYLDILAADEHEEAVWEGLSIWLQAFGSVWELCDFRSLHPHALLRKLDDSTYLFTAKTIKHQQYPIIELPGSWGEFEKVLSKNFRQELRYLPRRLEKEKGQFELRLVSEETFEEDMEALFDLHQMRWEGKGMPGVFSSEEVRQFHIEVARGFLQRGDLLLYTLWLKQPPLPPSMETQLGASKQPSSAVKAYTKAIGALYCLRQGAEIVYYLSGFHPDYREHSPVKILITQALKDGIANGANVFDFLKGEEDYKSRWRATNRWTYRLLVSRRGFRPWFVSTGLSLQPVVKEWRRRRKAKRAGT